MVVFDDYRAPAGRVDEAVGPDGAPRPAWRRAMPIGGGREDVVRAVGARAEATRLLADDGVTYNLHGSGSAGPAPRTVPWSLDPLPFVLDATEWRRLERGVAQRATLLDAVLADLYGSRDLVRRGLLPPEVVFAHRGFVRQCDGLRLPGPHQLFQYAADLARGADGRWVVLTDRTGAPSGVAYAAENRDVTSRLYPDRYRSAGVRRLAPHFHVLRAALDEVAPHRDEPATAVLLAPGGRAETAFEHSFLASRLGIPLVVGSDLVARDGRVWLRSLGRLLPVDVVLRRVDADYCDPLELRGESRLGVPGLLEAVRAGTVSVVNTLGSGVLENPGLLPFLPRIAQALLGESLVLDSVATEWCGDPAVLRGALPRLAELVVKPVCPRPGVRGEYFGPHLDRAALAALTDRVRARPAEWVVQELVGVSTAPTVVGGAVEPRGVLTRLYAVATGRGYHVMGGGLVRVAPGPRTLRISNGAGASAKDLWVVSSREVPAESAGPRGTEDWADQVPATAAVLPPTTSSHRVADGMYWLGRYCTRAEDTIRLLRAVHKRDDDFQRGADEAGSECLGALLDAVATLTSGAFRRRGPDTDLLALAADGERTGSVAYSATRLVASASEVSEQLSPDTWLVLGSLDREFAGLDEAWRRGEPGAETRARQGLDRALESLLGLVGLVTDGMVRDAAWRFVDLGRRLERALGVALLLRATLPQARRPAAHAMVVESALIAAESIVTYRRRYHGRPQIRHVLDLLLTDRDNPRSLFFQVDRMAEDVWKLPDDPDAASDTAPGELLQGLTARLSGLDTAALARTDDAGTRPALEEQLDAVVADLVALGREITAAYFGHVAPPRPFVTPGPGERDRV